MWVWKRLDKGSQYALFQDLIRHPNLLVRTRMYAFYSAPISLITSIHLNSIPEILSRPPLSTTLTPDPSPPPSPSLEVRPSAQSEAERTKTHLPPVHMDTADYLLHDLLPNMKEPQIVRRQALKFLVAVTNHSTSLEMLEEVFSSFCASRIRSKCPRPSNLPSH